MEQRYRYCRYYNYALDRHSRFGFIVMMQNYGVLSIIPVYKLQIICDSPYFSSPFSPLYKDITD